MRKFFGMVVFILFSSCSTFRTFPVMENDSIFGKGRLYLSQKDKVEHLDFVFSYEKKKLKIEGFSFIGTPFFQIFISDRTCMIVPKSKSYWEGNLRDLTKIYLKREITENEIISIFSGKFVTSFEVKKFFSNSNFPKEIIWEENGIEGKIKIKWFKKTSNLNLDLNIPSDFKKVSLEELSL